MCTVDESALEFALIAAENIRNSDLGAMSEHHRAYLDEVAPDWNAPETREALGFAPLVAT